MLRTCPAKPKVGKWTKIAPAMDFAVVILLSPMVTRSLLHDGARGIEIRVAEAGSDQPLHELGFGE